MPYRHRRPIPWVGIRASSIFRTLAVLLVLLAVAPGISSAAFNTSPADVQSLTHYVPWKDEYRTDIGRPPAGQWDTLVMYFETSNGTPYTLDYPAASAAQIFYLTCNGTYQFQYKTGGVNGTDVFWTGTIPTTAIQQPTCQSYGDGGARNDYNADYEETDGGYRVNWNGNGADQYEVWKDGQLVDTVSGSGPHQYDMSGPGTVTIVGRDSSGGYQGHSDLQVPTWDGTDGPSTGGGCDACKQLRDALACPEWDAYMGELTDAIKAALPPPPDWPSIADIFVDKFAEYFGEVPAPPTVQEIENEVTPELPPIDTAVPEADIDFDVPDDFNQPIPFDITDGPEIPVEDGSQPFVIPEPDSQIDADEPGKFVMPGDPQNHSGGIKMPDTIDTGYNSPVPTKQNGDDEIPPSDMPMPSGSVPNDPLPMPTESSGVIPIPNIN